CCTRHTEIPGKFPHKGMGRAPLCPLNRPAPRRKEKRRFPVSRVPAIVSRRNPATAAEPRFFLELIELRCTHRRRLPDEMLQVQRNAWFLSLLQTVVLVRAKLHAPHARQKPASACPYALQYS